MTRRINPAAAPVALRLRRPDIYGVNHVERHLVPQVIAQHVVGLMVEWRGETYIPLIAAVYEGKGDVGRFLDSQPVGSTWKVPAVINVRLLGMLKRRGFQETREWVDEHAEWTDVWVRKLEPAR